MNKPKKAPWSSSPKFKIGLFFFSFLLVSLLVTSFSFLFFFSLQKRLAGFFSASRLADCSGFLFCISRVSGLNDLGLRTHSHATPRDRKSIIEKRSQGGSGLRSLKESKGRWRKAGKGRGDGRDGRPRGNEIPLFSGLLPCYSPCFRYVIPNREKGM